MTPLLLATISSGCVPARVSEHVCVQNKAIREGKDHIIVTKLLCTWQETGLWAQLLCYLLGQTGQKVQLSHQLDVVGADTVLTDTSWKGDLPRAFSVPWTATLPHGKALLPPQIPFCTSLLPASLFPACSPPSLRLNRSVYINGLYCHLPGQEPVGPGGGSVYWCYFIKQSGCQHCLLSTFISKSLSFQP